MMVLKGRKDEVDVQRVCNFVLVLTTVIRDDFVTQFGLVTSY